MGDEDKVAIVFGRRVRALRMAKRKTQEQLGHAANIDYKHISAIERGATPSFEVVGKLAHALGVEFWQLFLPDRRPTKGLEKEINAALAETGQLRPNDVEEFLRTLRSAVRKLDRKAVGPHPR
jgi:transcriptional regulator with XRE-family HTH domain